MNTTCSMYEEWDRKVFSQKFDSKKDGLILSTIVIFFVCIRHFIIYRLGNIILNRTISNLDERKHIKQKFISALYRFFFYSFSISFELFILKNEKWILTPFEYTLDWKDNKVPELIRIQYFIQIGYYTTGLFFLFYEEKLKDFTIMVIHHIATIFLIIGSFKYNLFRYGIVVMAIHDISDPIMEFAKLNTYLKQILIANIVFSIFSLVFILSRLFIFPFLIIFPILYYLYLYRSVIFMIFDLFLITLFILHICWTYFILKMLKKIIVTKHLLNEDTRDDN